MMLSGIGNLSEGIVSGCISEAECEKLLIRSEHWRDWLDQADSDERMRTQATDAISKDSLLQKLPASRFNTFKNLIKNPTHDSMHFAAEPMSQAFLRQAQGHHRLVAARHPATCPSIANVWN